MSLLKRVERRDMVCHVRARIQIGRAAARQNIVQIATYENGH